MLMRTDPFRDLDRLTQQVLGTAARPAAMPMDAYRQGDSFYIHFDLPGVDASSIDLTVEQNVLVVHAERAPVQADGAEMIVAGKQDLLGGLRPRGVGVVLEAEHTCMTQRGIRAHGATTVTSALLGTLRTDPRSRAEFFALARVPMGVSGP